MAPNIRFCPRSRGGRVCCCLSLTVVPLLIQPILIILLISIWATFEVLDELQPPSPGLLRPHHTRPEWSSIRYLDSNFLISRPGQPDNPAFFHSPGSFTWIYATGNQSCWDFDDNDKGGGGTRALCDSFDDAFDQLVQRSYVPWRGGGGGASKDSDDSSPPIDTLALAYMDCDQLPLACFHLGIRPPALIHVETAAFLDCGVAYNPAVADYFLDCPVTVRPIQLPLVLAMPMLPMMVTTRGGVAPLPPPSSSFLDNPTAAEGDASGHQSFAVFPSALAQVTTLVSSCCLHRTFEAHTSESAMQRRLDEAVADTGWVGSLIFRASATIAENTAAAVFWMRDRFGVGGGRGGGDAVDIFAGLDEAEGDDGDGDGDGDYGAG